MSVDMFLRVLFC